MQDVQEILRQLVLHDLLIGMPKHVPNIIRSVCAYRWVTSLPVIYHLQHQYCCSRADARMFADDVLSACVAQMLVQGLLLCAAEIPPSSAGGSAPSSFGAALIRALPSEVQLDPDCVAQLEESKRSAGPEPRAVTALDAYQSEKAYVHGTLVSYLHSGWQSESPRKTSETEDDRGKSGRASRVCESAGGYVSRSSEPNPASESGCWQQSREITEQQRQEGSTALGMPDSQQPACRTDLNNALNLEQNLGESTGTLSRRDDALALLEGRHHSASPG